jgi:hypothetical protein
VIVAFAVNIFKLSINTNGLYLSVKASVIVAFPVNIFQLSVKYRRMHSVCKSASGVLKKIFRINNIKLDKLIVRKMNYAYKILLNIKKKKFK